jgi:mono/diheme cytochrome c family protein
LTTAKHSLRTLAALAASAAVLAGCTDWAGYDVDVAAGKVPQLATMRTSVIPDPYQMPRLPPEGSVPVVHPLGDVPAPYTSAQLDSVAPTLTSPWPAGAAPANVLARGREQYAYNCAVCHGGAGAGNGPVVGQGKFPFAPAINGAATAGRSDGYIYAVIDVGRGLMPAYGPRMTHADRWAVVAYVRQLQRQGGATPSAAGTVTQTPPQQTQPPPGTAPAGATTQADTVGTPASQTTPTGTDTTGPR